MVPVTLLERLQAVVLIDQFLVLEESGQHLVENLPLESCGNVDGPGFRMDDFHRFPTAYPTPNDNTRRRAFESGHGAFAASALAGPQRETEIRQTLQHKALLDGLMCTCSPFLLPLPEDSFELMCHAENLPL
ncbi:hypothetical protein EYF80_027393 [Liparis tanakae]|uniref:Uncharacterized protein n=1 Tax=Liparis tanakae TaxID=230148 RepID=A0A4Z2HC81_9TELE|nr:hypothetical protein EYF80_027393 [Liparis tanakae]